MDRKKVIGHLYDCLVASRLENMWVFVRKDIVGDALALLKEQEARVLNWDEVENYSVVYGEFRGEKEIFPLIITKDMSGRILSWNPGINRSGEYLLLVSDEEDRRNTRCWNIEPTDEQREATKWE